MHQGNGNNSDSGQKREPIAHAINPAGASAIGQMFVKNVPNLHEGRGFMAPAPMAETTHHCGSQGKHK